MRKIWKYITILFLVLTLFASACNSVPSNSGSGNTGNGGDTYKDYDANKKPGGDQFDYEGNYSAPELTINGLGDDVQWQAIKNPLATFGHGNAATVKAYRGQEALFFLFEVKDPILLTEGMSNDDSVTRSDSVEFYLDTLANGGSKPQSDDYQINLAIHGKTRIMQGSGSGWGNWNGLIDYEVTLNGTLNDGNDATDVGYVVEVMIPYSQINIEKDDTIAVSFGHVDKVNNGGSTPGTHWDWYGWDYGGIREPQTPDNYVLLDKNNNLIDRDAEARPNADIAGYVLDAISGQPVAGATVLIEGANSAWSLTTDAQGYFLLEKVESNFTYTATVTKNGYLGNSTTYSRTELRASNGGRVLKDIEIKNEESVSKTTLTGTVKNLINGAVGGATVSVANTLLTTTANANGEFVIEGVPVEENKTIALVVNANGYAESKTYVSSANLVENDVTALGDVNIHIPYATASGSNGFGLKSAKFADNSLRVGRALTGLEFLLSGTRKLDGNVEIYLDTKESSSEHRDNETSLWLFSLSGDGKIGGSHYKGGAFSLTGLEYNLFYNDATGYEARFFIPYEYLGIAPLEVFGISLGQWSTTASDWDGWGYAGQFIAPEYSNQYVRVSAINEFYRQDNNTSMVVLSGNTGIAGVRVSVGSYAATTGNDGAWRFRIPFSSEEITINYSCFGYEPITTVLPAGYFDTHYNFSEVVSMKLQYATISGVITDSQTGNAIEGATVTIEGTETVAFTDENGAYVLEGVWTKNNVNLIYECSDYATQTMTISSADLAANTSYVQNVKLVSTAQIPYFTAKGLVINVAGPVEGANVSLGDEVIATTEADGTFTIENFKGVDSVLTIEKAGYIAQTIIFKASDYVSGEEFTFATVDMPKEMVSLGVLEEKPADKQHGFAKFSAYVTRTATAFEFKFVGERAFNNGQLEVYIDTGAVSANKGAVEVQINIFSDKSINAVRGTDNSKLTAVFGGSDANPEIYLTVPYEALGINSTDIIGFYVGQWSTSVSDWDPLTYNGVSLNADNTSQYLRISGGTEVYTYATNEAVVTVKGNAGLGGVRVIVGSNITTTSSNGSFSMLIPYTDDEITVSYSKTGYVTATTVIPAGYFKNSIVFEDQVSILQHLVTMKGQVVDSVSGEAVAGVNVSVKGTAISTTTDENGVYSISNLSSNANIALIFELKDYASQEIVTNVSTLATATEHTVNVSFLCTKVINNVELFGSVTNVNGPIAGATVSVQGYSDLITTTNANGEFTIANVPAVDIVVTVVKDGYIGATLTVGENDFAEDATDHNLGAIDLMLNYERMPGVIADKASTFAHFTGYVTRSATGFEFKFIGKNTFAGQIELFVDIKTSAGDNARDLTDYLFLLKSDGNIQIINWGEGTKNESIPATMKLTVLNASTVPEVYFTLPYAFFGQINAEHAVSATEIIGISVGQWSTLVNDWDGWDCFALVGASNTEFVKPEMPTDYIRIAADNTLYAKADNVPVDFSSYYFHFGTGMMTTQTGATEAGAFGNAGLNADDIYGKIASRNANGVTFEFITTGNFSTNGGEKEMILIYFDTSAESLDGWKPDYLIKIASDGTVYGRANNAWWSASEADKLATTATITSENGVTKIIYTVSYDILGISSSDVFGVALRECAHSSKDHKLYDPWHDFYFANETTGRDAASCTQFIRVDANGNVYVDNNNNPND